MTLLQFILIQLNLVAFFVIYRLLASQKGHFKFNRFFLVIGPILAILLPFNSLNGSTNETFAVMLPAIEIINETGNLHSEAFNWTQFTLVLIAGCMFLLFVLSLFKILFPKRAKFDGYYKGYSVYLLEDDSSTTHSIFNKIYLHPSHCDHKEIVLEHEYAHCREYHSIDLLLMSLYRVLFWYNPIIYTWLKEVQLNHEYLADAHVLSNGVSQQNYGEILVALNFSCAPSSLVNAFNKPSSLRKRITHFNHQNKFNMKQLIIIPAVAVLAFATTSLTSMDIVPKNAPIIETPTGEPGPKPEFPGGQDGMLEYFSKTTTYPKSLIKEDAKGTVIVKFVVKADGSVSDVNAVKSSGYEEMDAEAIRVIQNMPKWKPAQKDGKAVAAEMTLPIAFTL